MGAEKQNTEKLWLRHL